MSGDIRVGVRVVACAVALLASGRALEAIPPPGVGLQVTAAGGGTSVGGSLRLTSTIGQNVQGPASGGGNAVAAGYLAPPPEDRDWTTCGLTQSGTYLFNLTYRVRLDVPVLGSLHCLRVRRTDGPHPDAIPGIDTARFWSLTAENAAGGPAGAYAVSLTFPQPAYADPFACRSLGGGAWDCARDAFTSSTVRRDAIAALSDWAVSDHYVVPVELLGFEAD